MTQEEFNQQYMHYYLGGDVRLRPVSIDYGVFEPKLQDVYGDLVAFKTWDNYDMILKDLADMSEEDADTFLYETSYPRSTDHTLKVENGVILIYHEWSTHPTKISLPYNLNPEQFNYLLKKGYNLFDPEWKFTIKAE